MTILKDSNYWKEYHLKRKLYIQQKNKERYLVKKGINTTTQLIQLTNWRNNQTLNEFQQQNKIWKDQLAKSCKEWAKDEEEQKEINTWKEADTDGWKDF